MEQRVWEPEWKGRDMPKWTELLPAHPARADRALEDVGHRPHQVVVQRRRHLREAPEVKDDDLAGVGLQPLSDLRQRVLQGGVGVSHSHGIMLGSHFLNHR